MRASGAIVASFLVLAVVACGSDDSAGTDAGGTTTAAPTTLPPDEYRLPQGDEPVELDPAEFTTDIDHPFWPMEVGTRWRYLETDQEGNELEVVVIVTELTEEIANGITARVVRDTVTENDQIIEDTFDWFAQDAEGNLWYLGEDTAEFEDGEVTSTEGSWEAGVDGALPGIILPADPQPGMRYRQEYYEGEAEDNGEVLQLDGTAEVSFGSFTDCLVTEDTNALEPGAVENKFFARGVGLVLTVDMTNGGGGEELVSVDQAPSGAGTGPLGSPTS